MARLWEMMRFKPSRFTSKNWKLFLDLFRLKFDWIELTRFTCVKIIRKNTENWFVTLLKYCDKEDPGRYLRVPQTGPLNTRKFKISMNTLITYQGLGAVQKIRVKIGGREGSCHSTQNVTVGEGGVQQFNTWQL